MLQENLLGDASLPQQRTHLVELLQVMSVHVTRASGTRHLIVRIHAKPRRRSTFFSSRRYSALIVNNAVQTRVLIHLKFISVGRIGMLRKSVSSPHIQHQDDPQFESKHFLMKSHKRMYLSAAHYCLYPFPSVQMSYACEQNVRLSRSTR